MDNWSRVYGNGLDDWDRVVDYWSRVYSNGLDDWDGVNSNGLNNWGSNNMLHCWSMMLDNSGKEKILFF